MSWLESIAAFGDAEEKYGEYQSAAAVWTSLDDARRQRSVEALGKFIDPRTPPNTWNVLLNGMLRQEAMSSQAGTGLNDAMTRLTGTFCDSWMRAAPNSERRSILDRSIGAFVATGGLSTQGVRWARTFLPDPNGILVRLEKSVWAAEQQQRSSYRQAMQSLPQSPASRVPASAATPQPPNPGWANGSQFR